jgi:hypothetical protein
MPNTLPSWRERASLAVGAPRRGGPPPPAWVWGRPPASPPVILLVDFRIVLWFM